MLTEALPKEGDMGRGTLSMPNAELLIFTPPRSVHFGGCWTNI